MDLSYQTIALRRNKIMKVHPDVDENHKGGGSPSKNQVATFSLNLQDLGYVLSPEAADYLSSLTNNQFLVVTSEVTDILRDLRGVRSYQPMYPNFPKQVMEMDEAELYANATWHYITSFLSDVTDGQVQIELPKYDKKTRKPLKKRKISLTVLTTADMDTMRGITRDLVNSNTSLTDVQKAEMRYLLSTVIKNPELESYKPTFKENMAIMVNTLLANNNATIAFPYVKTATDVLRLIAEYSGNNVSLTGNQRIAKLPRSLRRKYMALLDNVKNPLPDMWRHRALWLKAANSLHPGEYSGVTPKASAAFHDLRFGPKPVTVASMVETALVAGKANKASKLLTDRPGEFARRLDHLLRLAKPKQVDSILSRFASASGAVSTPVLLQVMGHFKNRPSNNIRVVFPKGAVAKVAAIPAPEPLDDSVCQKVVSIVSDTLRERFSNLDDLGKVYIDPELQSKLLPFSQRSASDSLKTAVRGSSFPMDGDSKKKMKCVRAFIYWKEQPYDRTDLDLSCQFLNKDFENTAQVAYYNLKGEGFYHSGDIVSAPQGAAEFIDVNIDEVLDNYPGTRYMLISVNSFTGQTCKEMADCRAGWMMRNKVNSGEIFEPSTVENVVDLTVEAKSFVPALFDLVERRVIWVDMPYLTGSAKLYGVNNIHKQLPKLQVLCKAFTNLNTKPSVFDLLQLHASSRGQIIQDKKEADTIFDKDMAFDLEDLAANYMI